MGNDHAGMKWEEYEDLVERDGLKILTLEGKMNADIGDWIIRGVKGELYPCKADILSLPTRLQIMNQIKTWQQRQAETGIGSVEAKDDEIRDLRQAIEQAGKAEPVLVVARHDLEKLLKHPEGDKHIKAFIPPGMGDEVLLYTHPPTAPAQPYSGCSTAQVDPFVQAPAQQPLTDEQIEAIAAALGFNESGPHFAFARAIEAHIKGAL